MIRLIHQGQSGGGAGYWMIDCWWRWVMPEGELLPLSIFVPWNEASS